MATNKRLDVYDDLIAKLETLPSIYKADKYYNYGKTVFEVNRVYVFVEIGGTGNTNMNNSNQEGGVIFHIVASTNTGDTCEYILDDVMVAMTAYNSSIISAIFGRSNSTVIFDSDKNVYKIGASGIIRYKSII